MPLISQRITHSLFYSVKRQYLDCTFTTEISAKTFALQVIVSPNQSQRFLLNDNWKSPRGLTGQTAVPVTLYHFYGVKCE